MPMRSVLTDACGILTFDGFSDFPIDSHAAMHRETWRYWLSQMTMRLHPCSRASSHANSSTQKSASQEVIKVLTHVPNHVPVTNFHSQRASRPILPILLPFTLLCPCPGTTAYAKMPLFSHCTRARARLKLMGIVRLVIA